MSKLFKNGESLEVKLNKIVDECDNVINDAFKASGISFMDVMKNVDKQSAEMIGSMMSLYNQSMEFATMQAAAMDRMLNDLEELRSINEDIRKQNECLRDDLCRFKLQITKSEN